MKTICIICMFLLLIQLVHGERDWVSSYYLHPTPENFSQEVRAIVNSGEFDKSGMHPAFVGFISQVMAQNPDKVKGWLTEFEDLEQEKRTTLLVAAWFSGTQSAREYFSDHGLDEYLKGEPKSLMTIKVDSADTLDILWGYFMARGDEESIRRIITAFDLAKYEGSIDRYKYETQSEEAWQAAYLEATFQAAVWSVESNCNQHPQVLAYCESIFADKTLPKMQSEQLGKVLAKVKPAQYKVEKGLVIDTGAVSGINIRK